MKTVTREQLADALRDLEAALESMRIGPDKAMYSNSVMAKRLAASELISCFDAPDTEAEQDLAQKCVELAKEMAERFNWVHSDQADTFSGLRTLGEQEFFAKAAALFDADQKQEEQP